MILAKPQGHALRGWGKGPFCLALTLLCNAVQLFPPNPPMVPPHTEKPPLNPPRPLPHTF